MGVNWEVIDNDAMLSHHSEVYFMPQGLCNDVLVNPCAERIEQFFRSLLEFQIAVMIFDSCFYFQCLSHLMNQVIVKKEHYADQFIWLGFLFCKIFYFLYLSINLEEHMIFTI